MDTFNEQNEQKGANIFFCKKCNYICSSKYNFSRHISTQKHTRIHLDQKDEQTSNYACKCGKIYKYSQGLSKHKLSCIQNIQPQIDTNFVIELLKQNQELQKSLIELSKEKTITNNSISNTI